MEKGLALLSTESRVVTKADPRLRLLLELQPRHEVFFNNLADAILRRKPAPFKGTSPPGPFWHDVFVPTEMPWKSFQESLLWHMVVMIAAWALTQGWASRPKPHVNQSSYRASGAVYYSPSKAYPSARSSTPRQTTHATTHAKGRGASASAHAKALPVAPENRGTPKLVLPPDLKLAEGPRSPNLAADPTMPAVPLSATARTNSPVSGLNAAVAPPPPDVNAQRKGLPGSLQAGVLAPPVDARGIAGDHTLRGPGASNVIAPPPGLQGQGLRASSGGPRGLAAGGAVVPPPPSVEHSGKAGALSGPGVAVVPPPPSLQGAGIGGGNGRGTSANGVGAAVVPPPPSVQGSGAD